MKRIIILLITAIAVMFGGMAFMAPAANASEQSSGTSAEDTPEDCQAQDGSTGNGECGYVEESESHSSSGGKSKSVSRNGVSISSHITVLANIRAEGTPRDQQDNCWRTKHAMSAWTTYDASGTTGSWYKPYPKGYRFCTMDNGQVRDPICHNLVKIGRPKSNPPKNAVFGEVKFVKRIHWKVVSVSEADELAVAKAKAWCNTSSASAFAQAKGSAMARASARAVAKGYVLVKVMARAEAASNHAVAIQLGAESLIQVRVNTRTEAVAKAKAEASAKVSCSDNPPETTPPTFVQFRQINDVYVNATTDHCVTVDFPDGHSGTVFWTADKGSFAITTKTAQDMVQVCSTYKAPSEVPASGTDTITVTATDSVTGRSVSKTTDPFVIKAMPATP